MGPYSIYLGPLPYLVRSMIHYPLDMHFRTYRILLIFNITQQSFIKLTLADLVLVFIGSVQTSVTSSSYQTLSFLSAVGLCTRTDT
jgi:hypothetical protein